MTRYLTMIAVLLLPVGIAGCLYDSPESYSNSVDQMSFERKAGEFSSVRLRGNYLVRLENAEVSSVEINAHDDLKKLIFVEIRDGVLTVKNVEERTLNNRNKAELVIKAPEIEFIEVLESAKIVADQPFRFDELRIESAGALKMDIELIGNQFTGVFAGATDLNLRGEVKKVKFNIPGAGKVSAFDLKTQELDLSMSGAAKAEVYAEKRLKVDVAGACTVVYKGNPDEVFTNISGIGRVNEAR
ncbi:head GIN domain-containing protein [Marinilabilia sp.]|uniref:head GIN domain-containing protein n=1 Tax=Marinilabilia sp. TaxID=2021252 RepID=UPI0025C225B9|nr:head GIN domain-containing protein [Marinilabilia sp.]